MRLCLSFSSTVLLVSGLSGVESFSIIGLPRRHVGGGARLLNNRPWTPPRPQKIYNSSPVVPKSTTSTSLSALSNIAAAIQSLHGNASYVLTVILWLSTFGVSLERRTTIGKALSAPLATMALALTTANLGLVPFESPIYSMINRFLVPLAVPLLLFDSDLNRVINDTGTLLMAFGVGALATVVGTIVAFPLIPLASLGPDVGWRVACALAARHIGGAINFVAVAETLNIGGSAVSAAIAADNVVVALYFAFLFSIAKAGEPSTEDADTQKVDYTDPENTISELVVEKQGASSSITLATLGISISIASTLVSSGVVATRLLLPMGTSSLPLISVLTVIAATIFPKFFSRISETGTALGVTFIQMFFAASGAAGSIRLVMQQAPALFAFSALQIGVHFGTTMAIGRGIFRLPKRELYLASNANVGGPTTAGTEKVLVCRGIQKESTRAGLLCATFSLTSFDMFPAAMAQAKEWKRLVLPALLIGILGYACATPIALALGPILLRIPLIR